MLKFKNYVIKPSGFQRYDLFKTGISKKKGSEETYESTTNIAWSLPFDRCLHYLLVEMTDAADTKTVEGYIEKYKSILEEVKQIL